MIRGPLLLVLGLSLSACEGHFAGDRPANVSTLNGPFTSKVRDINGQPTLAVLSSNSQQAANGGNIRFFDVTDPANPILTNAVTPIAIPSNVNDFEIVDTMSPPKLYVLSRNEDAHQVWIYELSGTTFVRKTTGGTIESCVNAMNVTPTIRAGETHPHLAITCERSGTVVLMSTVTDTMVTPTSLGIAAVDSVTLGNTDLVGAGFYMRARRSQDASRDDRINISFGRREGIGINSGAFLPSAVSADNVFVTSNLGQNAFYSFRFSTFTNAANIVWDIPEFRGNTRLSETEVRRGTGDSGFGGLAVDGNGNVFLASRTDNSIYRVPVAEVLADKTEAAGVANRNTKGFDQNNRTYRILTESTAFDPDITDQDLPQLSNLTVQQVGGDASLVWVIGTGSRRLYRVTFDPTSLAVSAVTQSEVIGTEPQKLLGLPVGAVFTHIYVSDPTRNAIYVLDATTLAVVKTMTE